MKKKIIVTALAVLLLIPLLSLTAFAADDDFSFWDLIDSIGDGINAVIRSISNGLKAIGDFFANLIKAIGNAVNALLDGLKWLFIPRSDYFTELMEKISNAFGKKFGGVLSLANYLKTRFSGLSSYSNPDFLTFTFPHNSLLAGNSLNLFGIGGYFSSLVRSVLTGFVTLCTVAVCYRKVKELISV